MLFSRRDSILSSKSPPFAYCITTLKGRLAKDLDQIDLPEQVFIEKSIVVGNDIGVANRGEDPNFVECIFAVLQLEAGEIDLFKGI